MRKIHSASRGRVFRMTVLVALLGSPLPLSAMPVTIDFDDIATPQCGTGFDSVPGGYGGFTWSSSFAVECDVDYLANSGNSAGAPSAANAVYNAFGELQLTITRVTSFTFDGGMFSGWAFADDYADGYTATDITITGYLGDDFVGTTGLQSLDSVYAFIHGFAGAIDRLDLTTSGASWLMDDVQFGDPPSVPEPATVLLLGAGLAVVVGRRFRRRVSTSTSGVSSC